MPTPIGDEGCTDDDDDADDDPNKENTIPDAQENPWKLSREELALYDDIFPGASLGGNAKSEKNKVIGLWHL